MSGFAVDFGIPSTWFTSATTFAFSLDRRTLFFLNNAFLAKVSKKPLKGRFFSVCSGWTSACIICRWSPPGEFAPSPFTVLLRVSVSFRVEFLHDEPLLMSEFLRLNFSRFSSVRKDCLTRAGSLFLGLCRAGVSTVRLTEVCELTRRSNERGRFASFGLSSFFRALDSPVFLLGGRSGFSDVSSVILLLICEFCEFSWLCEGSLFLLSFLSPMQ